MSLSIQEQVSLFRSVFTGRTDVFAVRWEKAGKTGYTPAYRYDPYLYRQHKMGGGTFQNYPDKTHLPLSDAEIIKHLHGGQLIGVYPLLQDNTSWFLAADFDKDNWTEECRKFVKTCADNGIPAYLERSRSGKGGHVWIFFEQPYPAVRSRNIFIRLLEKSGIFSAFDKGSSFDRLFPNQDFLSGKGLGNLIALPLYKPTWELGNSCFVDVDTLQPFDDQWKFLQSIHRVAIAQLEQLFQSVNTVHDANAHTIIPEKVTIALDYEVRIVKSSLTSALIAFLKEEFNFANTEFFVKQNSGKSTWDTDRYFKLFKETADDVAVPRGGIGKIIRFCRDQNIAYDFKDLRKKLSPVFYSFTAELRPNQRPAVEAAAKKDFGVIVAPPGAGKTVIGLRIIADKQQPALILVHRKQLMEQWVERIAAFLGIPKQEIGRIGQGKRKIGKQITIATVQSLAKEIEKPDRDAIKNAFGTLLIDECHHVPASTFRDTISEINSWHLYGLTATPFRKYSDGKMIFIFLGDVIAEIKSVENDTQHRTKIIIQETALDVPFNPKTDKFETLSKVLVHDSGRNRLILEDVKKEVKSGRKVVVITERKEHIEALFQYLKQVYEVMALSGDDSENQRNAKWDILKAGNYQVLITTGQLFGEGTDLNNANCLFLIYPFAFEGKLIQYIGRVQRGEISPVIYDYHDRKVDYLHRLFLKRNVHYRKIAHQATLFDEPQEDASAPVDTFLTIQETAKLAFEALEFQYGAIAFSYPVPKENLILHFEIENDHIRPELEVIKPYFAKKLQIKQVQVNIFAEIEHGEVLSQAATSDDLNRINQEVIDSVKFRFVEKELVGQQASISRKKGLLDADQLQENDQKTPLLYATAAELLEDVLQNKQAKHFQQLRYLADRHEHTILKLRFALSPFSFVFLLAGETQYHLVLETLDTEEATYIWHVPKDKTALRGILQRIDEDINTIRQHGRQYFLDANPTSFSRVVHDYAEARKGFVVWKGLLEERLG